MPANAEETCAMVVDARMRGVVKSKRAVALGAVVEGMVLCVRG